MSFDFFLSVGIVAAAFFLRSQIVHTILGFIHMVDGLDKEKQAQSDKVLRSPLSFLTVLAAFFLADIITDFPEELEFLHHHAQITLLNIFVFWAVYHAIDPVSKAVYDRGTHSFGEEVRNLTVKVLKLLALCLGLLSILQAWGVNVAAFLAGLGLIGMAIALAAQDTMKNFFGSVVVLADKMFAKGDWVKSPQVEGIIEKFGIRTTVVRGFDDAEIHIPNAALADTTIINFSRCGVRKIEMTLPLGCPVSEDHLQTIVHSYRKYLEHHASVIQPPRKPVLVYLDKFGENCIELFIYFFVRETDWTPYMEVKEKIILDFKKLAAEAGINFGVPTRLLLVHKQS